MVDVTVQVTDTVVTVETTERTVVASLASSQYWTWNVRVTRDDTMDDPSKFYVGCHLASDFCGYGNVGHEAAIGLAVRLAIGEKDAPVPVEGHQYVKGECNFWCPAKPARARDSA